jgi:NTE family protein
MREITLALGGGGVKGYAHIGILRVLEQEGFQVRAIAGTSAGGLVGALYAHGYSPDEILQLIAEMNMDTAYAREPEDGPSWMGISGIRRLMEKALAGSCFEELRIPFAVVAVDLNTAEHVVLNRGNVVEALSATIAVPGVFPAARLGGRTLVDGGVLDPVPVGVARSFFPELPVVAGVLSPALESWAKVEKPRLLSSLPVLDRYLGRLRIAQALNILMRSMDISGTLLTELLLAAEAPDVIIRPDLPHIGLLDRVDAVEVAQLGEAATRAVLPELQQATSWQARLLRPVKPQPTWLLRLPYTTVYHDKKST